MTPKAVDTVITEMNNDPEKSENQPQPQNPAPTTVKPVAKPLLTRMVWHPMFGIIVGAIIAGYFYYLGIREPELTIYVRPSRIPLVQLGAATNLLEVSRNIASYPFAISNEVPAKSTAQQEFLKVLFNDFFTNAERKTILVNVDGRKVQTMKPINGNVSTVEVEFWNQGKASIHKANILKPVSLQFKNNCEILQVTATENNETVGYHRIENGKNNILIFDWDILQHNDGIKL